jgi:hypothetical protein
MMVTSHGEGSRLPAPASMRHHAPLEHPARPKPLQHREEI